MRIILTTIFFLAACWQTFAQDSKGKGVVLSDPLFWKDELSLKAQQSRKIAEINDEFYANLRKLRLETHDRSELRRILSHSLQERSQKIWDTLHPKQRKRLERIIENENS